MPPMDCLAAGTLIWTARGALPVEQIQVGDLTLSQDPVTGELAYKPVVRTTLRPACELVQIYAGNQMFECSGGHPFWVSGKGWVKARDLQSGSQLHTVNGTLQISSVETGSTQETFNLVVDGFHTYFVGSDKVLSHDNYTFYNRRLHADWSSPDSPVLLFEGTYTAMFADKPPPTPRYDYNQILYRLDLDDEALKPARELR